MFRGSENDSVNRTVESLLKTLRIMPLLVFCALAQQVLCAERLGGEVVWWGVDFANRLPYPGPTNGVVECGDEILSNVVAIAAGGGTGLALRDDGTVFAFGDNIFGGNDVPAGLSNVISIAVGGTSCWAIKRDGTVTRWGRT